MSKAKKNEHILVSVSPEIYAILDYWAWLNGRTVAMFLAQLGSARVGANLNEIEELGKFTADLQGITLEQLKQKWRDSRANSAGTES